MKLRRIASLTLFLSLFLMLLTSVVLYVVPQGRVAYWAEWTFLGLDKTEWGALHTNLGFLMVLAGLVHLWFNWGPVKAYLKNKTRQMRVATPAFVTALMLTLVFASGTLLRVPPLVWIQDLGEHFKDQGAATYGEPPYGHAELSSLRVFLRNVDLEPERARTNLTAAGITVPDPEITVAELARRAGLTPQRLYEVMLGPEEQRPAGPRPIPAAMPMGTGRKSLETFCREYNRDPHQALEVLTAAGLTASLDHTLRDIAEANGREALDILDALRSGLDGIAE